MKTPQGREWGSHSGPREMPVQLAVTGEGRLAPQMAQPVQRSPPLSPEVRVSLCLCLWGQGENV